MILSDNTKPDMTHFQALMRKLDDALNYDATKRESYYIGRTGLKLEKDVYEALCDCAHGTPFQNSVQLISGASFPDIVIGNRYGVEVKSTEKDKWTSVGSSILESTRNQNVERIFMTFGKMGKPVRFLSKPYEQCLSGIAVTHYPRYLIDMRLAPGTTIFDKMGVSYDHLRSMDEPASRVADYYRSTLREGEQLWWTGNDNHIVPPAIRAWSVLSAEEKALLTAKGFVYFPEVAGPSSPFKYNRFSLWLATEVGVVNPNARDAFSAGGQVQMKMQSGQEIKVPAYFKKIDNHCELIEKILQNESSEVLSKFWNESVDTSYSSRIQQWCFNIADASNSTVGFAQAQSILHRMFGVGTSLVNKRVPSFSFPSTPPQTVSSKMGLPNCSSASPAPAIVNKHSSSEKKPVSVISIRIGDVVHHDKYGDGKVVQVNTQSGYISIKFTTTEKTFSYPNAFDQGFLTKK